MPINPEPLPSSSGRAALRLFVLNSSHGFGALVGHLLGVAPSAHDERDFEDGEHKCRPLVSVRDSDTYVVDSLYADDRQSPNDKLCRLLFFIGALKDAGASRVTAVVPYLAYAREDRKTVARDPVTTRYVAALLEAVGTDVVITMDVHNLAAYQNAFRCRSEHLQATQLFIAHFAPQLQEREVVVVSPDAGGIKRAGQFRQSLARVLARPVGAAFAEKYRDGEDISGELLVGDVRGKDAIIIDDLISTGSTLARAARKCLDHGAARVMAAATHGLFIGDAAELLAGSGLEQIAVTDTVPPFRLPGDSIRGRIRLLSCTGLFAAAIDRLHRGASLSELPEI